MASVYPASFDTMSDPAANLSGPPTHSAIHLLENDAIEAIEAELGLNPSGASATVAARLTAIDAAITAAVARAGALTSWTPSVIQGGAVTVTNTYSRYTRIGRLVSGWFYLAVTGAGTPSNAIIISTPTTVAATCYLAVGSGEKYRLSTTTKTTVGVFIDADSANYFDLRADAAQQDNRLGIGGSISNAGLAAGDTLSGCFTYEAATD